MKSNEEREQQSEWKHWSIIYMDLPTTLIAFASINLASGNDRWDLASAPRWSRQREQEENKKVGPSKIITQHPPLVD